MSLNTLSKSQQEVAQAFSDFLQDSNQHSIVISGFAGSGKSYLVRYLYQMAVKINKMSKILDSNDDVPAIYFTATTNKAAHVLSDLTGQTALTVHSLLGLKVTNDYSKGITKLKETFNTSSITNALIFLDESSMVDRELAKFIELYLKSSKIVYIGDSYQLPPVFENNSVVFDNPNIYYLKEIQRQVADHPIIQLSAAYRAILDQTPPFVWPDIVEAPERVVPISGPGFQREIDRAFTQKQHLDDAKIICYTNKKAIQYNKYVRSLYTKEDHFIVGEKVIVNNPITIGTQVVLPTDSVATVTKIESAKSTDDIEGYNIQLNDRYMGFCAANHLDTDTLSKHFAKHKDWTSYFRIKESYWDLRSPYALTCHKSQGSTYKEVFVDLNDIGTNMKWYEVARLVYVAITRASERVYLYGSLTNRWNK